MAATKEAGKVSVRAKASFGAPGWSCEKGDVIEVSLTDARRMIVRGLAEELKEAPLPRASDDDAEAARVVEVATVEVTGNNMARVRPMKRS